MIHEKKIHFKTTFLWCPDPVWRPQQWVLEQRSLCCDCKRVCQCWLLLLDRWPKSHKQKLNKKLWNPTWGFVRRHPALISDVERAGQKPRRQYSLLEHVPHPPIHQACSCLGRKTTLPFCWSQADWIICDRPRTPIHFGQILRHRSSVLDNWLWCQCMQRHLVLTALGWSRTIKPMLWWHCPFSRLIACSISSTGGPICYMWIISSGSMRMLSTVLAKHGKYQVQANFVFLSLLLISKSVFVPGTWQMTCSSFWPRRS